MFGIWCPLIGHLASGAIARVGDTLVWSEPSGQKVLGGLEMMTDSQARIENAVNGIETAQVAMQGGLGVVQNPFDSDPRGHVSFGSVHGVPLAGAEQAD